MTFPRRGSLQTAKAVILHPSPREMAERREAGGRYHPTTFREEPFQSLLKCFSVAAEAGADYEDNRRGQSHFCPIAPQKDDNSTLIFI